MASPFGTNGGSSTQSALLHPSYGRATPERIKAGLGSSSNAASFVSASIPLVLTIANRNLVSDQSTVPTDWVAYGQAITDIINHYGAANFALILIEDEPMTLANFAGTAAEFAEMVDVARTAAAALGVKVASGAIKSDNIVYVTYQDFIDRGLTAEAADYWTRASSGSMTTAQAAATATLARAWLDEIAASSADYLGANLHTPANGWSEAADFLFGYTGKIPILARYDQMDDLPATTDLLFADARDAGTPIVLLQIVTASPAHALVSGSSLTTIGAEWVALIIAEYEQTGSNAECLFGIHASPRPDDEAVIIANGKVPAGTATTNLGISGFGTTAPVIIPMAAKLGSRFVRSTAFLKTPGTFSADPTQIRAAGLKIALNVHNAAQPPPGQPPGASTSAPDIPAYKAAVALALDQALPDLVVVENEISFTPHFSGTAPQYQAMLAGVIEVAHARGIPVATDGTISRTAIANAYLILVAEGRATEAADLWAVAGGGNPVPSPSAGWDKWLIAYDGANPDFINIHVYFEDYAFDPDALASVLGAFSRRIGVPCITNECNPCSLDGTVMTTFLNQFSSLDTPWVVIWSHDTAQAVNIFDTDGSLKFENDGGLYGPGEAMRDHLALGGVPFVAEKNAIIRLESELDPQRTFGADRIYRPLSPGAGVIDDYVTWTIDQDRRVVLSVDSATTDGVIVPFADVAAGLYDADIDDLADAIKALDPTPVYLCYTHEPDLTYFKTGETAAQTQASYRAAWQRIHGRFVAKSVTNVDWTLILAGASYSKKAGIYPADAWNPGGSYVDVYGGDFFNPFGAFGTTWGSFYQRTADFVVWARAGGYARWLIAETGSLEDPLDPNRKALWIRELRAYVEDSLPEIECVAFYNGGPYGWWIEQPPQGSLQALVEFSAMSAEPYYGGTGGPAAPRHVVALVVTPSQVGSGDAAIGTVYLDGAATAGGVDVAVLSDAPEASPPATVHISEGATSLDFLIPTSPVGVEVEAMLTAVLGSSSATASLVIGTGIAPPGSTEPGRFEYVYNGLRIGGDITPFNVETVDGLGDFVMREEITPKGARHGSFTFAKYMEERRIVLAGNVFGPTAVARARRLQQLAVAFVPDDVERELKFQYIDGVIKLVRAKTTRRDIPMNKVAAKDGTPFTIELIASDPLVYEEPARTLELLPANVGVSGVLMPVVMPAVFAIGATAFGEALNIGTIGAPIVVRFIGPATDPQLTNLETGELVKFDITLAAGEEMVVDFGAETVLIGEVSRYVDLDPESTFFGLDPGTTRLQFLADSISAQTRAIVGWSSTWAAAL